MGKGRDPSGSGWNPAQSTGDYYLTVTKAQGPSNRRVCVCVGGCVLSRVQLFVNPQTVACQAPLSMGFSKQEYWSGLPFPSPEELPDPGIKPASPALQAYL